MSYKDCFSKTYRKFVEDNNIEFEDWKKAWIVYHHTCYDCLDDKIKDLKEISDQTSDEELKRQINVYVNYVEKSIDLFKKNDSNSIYTLTQIEVRTDTYYNCGYYIDYNNVRKAADNIKGDPYCITKSELIKNVDSSYREKFEEYEIQDEYISRLKYNKKGKLYDFITDEAEEDYGVEFRDIFFNKFIHFPNPFHAGDILKKVIDINLDKIQEDKLIYILSYEQQEDRSKKYSILDYSDSGIIADFLCATTGNIWNSDTPEPVYEFDLYEIDPSTEDVAERIMLSWQGLVRGEPRGSMQYIRDGCQVLRELRDDEKVHYITGLSTRYYFN